MYIYITFLITKNILNNINFRNKISEHSRRTKEIKIKLQKTKENVNSTEYIEEVAREKLDMYLPNESSLYRY